MITNIVNHDYPRSYQSERYTQNACSVWVLWMPPLPSILWCIIAPQYCCKHRL
jgi:hypothetical protein